MSGAFSALDRIAEAAVTILAQDAGTDGGPAAVAVPQLQYNSDLAVYAHCKRS
jgi:hypothetical protein